MCSFICVDIMSVNTRSVYIQILCIYVFACVVSRERAYRGFLHVSSLSNRLAVLLVCYFHPLHRRHDAAAAGTRQGRRKIALGR